MGIAGVVLAAGAGSRMGTPKAELVVGGRSLLDRAVSALAGGGCSPVLAVLRPALPSLPRAALPSLPRPAEQAPACAPEAPSGRQFARVVNPDPDRGLRSSLEAGLDGLDGPPAPEVDAVAVVLVDVPGLTAAAVADVVQAWRPGRIAVGVARGRRTHPTVMSLQMWRDAVVLAEPDEGARRYLRAHPGLVDEIEVDIDPTDLDTPRDLAAWTE